MYLQDLSGIHNLKLSDTDVSGEGMRESLVILLHSTLEFLWISSCLSSLSLSLSLSLMLYLNFVDSDSGFAGWLLKILLRKVPFMKL